MLMGTQTQKLQCMFQHWLGNAADISDNLAKDFEFYLLIIQLNVFLSYFTLNVYRLNHM